MPDGVTAVALAGQGAQAERTVQVRLLGPFVMSVSSLRSVSGGAAGERVAGPWPRPSARRLCELLLVSPGHRIRRDLACEALFGDRDQRTASRALSKALSMARAALTGLGESGGSLLAADRTHIWVAGPVEIDAEAEEEALAGALALTAGNDRTRRLRAVLSGATAGDELLADEPDEEWARAPRERLAALRQEARLALARDLAPAGIQDEVLAAWQSCLDHDPACEEAAGALARAYIARHRPERAARVLQRCRVALEDLGLRLSPSLESAYAAAVSPPVSPAPAPSVPVQPLSAQPLSAQAAVGQAGPREERRPVSVLFAEVAAPAGTAATLDLEALRESVGGVLAAVITEVEALGGLVTSVSGRGLEALFGVPAAHEDDPERAVRAAFRAAARTSPATVLRIGVESGPAVVGPAVGGTGTTYTAFGEVVNLAAALQSAARPGSVLVGPATRAAAGHLFAWDAPERVTLDPRAEPVVASYLDAPRARSGERRAALGGTAPLAGREEPMRVLSGALRELAGGRGSVVVLTGEPGLGKTRLVQEARARFIAWAGAGTGRIPQWAEARCTSYTSDTPYGLYRELLASWTGTSPDERPAIRLLALEQALQRLMGNLNLLPSLARMAGLPDGGPGISHPGESRLRADPADDLRRDAGTGDAPGRGGADGAGAGRPALVRPDVAPSQLAPRGAGPGPASADPGDRPDRAPAGRPAGHGDRPAGPAAPACPGRRAYSRHVTDRRSRRERPRRGGLPGRRQPAVP